MNPKNQILEGKNWTLEGEGGKKLSDIIYGRSVRQQRNLRQGQLSLSEVGHYNDLLTLMQSYYFLKKNSV